MTASEVASTAGFDAILAHHSEAALAALHGLPRSHPPIIYCAHTLLEQELPLYLESFQGLTSGPVFRSARRAIARVGGAIDRWIAHRADGWIALTQSSERVIRASSRAICSSVSPP